MPLLLRRDADARVADGDMQRDPLLGLRLQVHAHGDLAPLGELAGVADEVDKDLAEASRVAHQGVRHVGGEPVGQLQTLLVHLRRQGLHRVAEGVPEAEGGRLQLELPGLDLGEVEDVVQEPQQRLGGGFGQAEELALARVDGASGG